jgi:hypothetical protein
MPVTVDSTTSAETGGRKDDPSASQVQINFTGTTPENILQLFLTIQVYMWTTSNMYSFRRIFFKNFALKGWNVKDSITFLSRKIPVPEIIDPVFAKTSQNARFLLSEYERFGLVFTKTRVYKFGHRIVYFLLKDCEIGYLEKKSRAAQSYAFVCSSPCFCLLLYLYISQLACYSCKITHPFYTGSGGV